MKSFLDLCERRHSVREYDSRQVPAEDMEYIMECVRLAPSAVNYQPWRFIHVSEEERGLVNSCYHNPWFATAPECVIACCNHRVSWHRKLDGCDHGAIDVAIAVEHFCLAAAERGLGSCWVCNFDAKRCQELLHLPEEIEPIVLLPLGFEAEGSVGRERKRLAPEDLWLKR